MPGVAAVAGVPRSCAPTMTHFSATLADRDRPRWIGIRLPIVAAAEETGDAPKHGHKVQYGVAASTLRYLDVGVRPRTARGTARGALLDARDEPDRLNRADSACRLASQWARLV